MTTYQEFLASKRRRVEPVGPVIDTDSVNPMLHDWQQAITVWAVNRGRAAIFADCGLGKTFMQVEWARNIADRCLIVAPLSVARQTVREADKIDVPVTYARHETDAEPHGITITNYEMLNAFDVASWPAIVLDESSILKNVDGTTRKVITDLTRDVKYRLACTATPAPNDVSELCNHAEFIGALPRNEMLAAYFVHDDEGWRPKRHALQRMYEWMANWSVALRRPSDLGWADTGYDLPDLNIIPQSVAVDIAPEGQLFATELGGIGGRAQVRRQTLDARAERAVELATSNDDQWIVWCGLNDEASHVAANVPDSVNVVGSMTPEQKADALERFQDGDIRVLITKPSIAGFGMNFQNCHQMVFVGMSDSWESYYQAIRRCWRFGQDRQVDAHIVVSELETQIVDNVRRKETQAVNTAAQLSRYSHVRNETP
jgi:hypothetical protein